MPSWGGCKRAFHWICVEIRSDRHIRRELRNHRRGSEWPILLAAITSSRNCQRLADAGKKPDFGRLLRQTPLRWPPSESSATRRKVNLDSSRDHAIRSSCRVTPILDSCPSSRPLQLRELREYLFRRGCGVLLYTASSDAEGTVGGLV